MTEFWKQKGSDTAWTIVKFPDETEITLDGIPMVIVAGDRLAFSKKGQFKFINDKLFRMEFELEEE